MRFVLPPSIYRYLKYHNVRVYSVHKLVKNDEIERIRNIGILAHIDAGKTTTTERMLYYSGLIKQMGEVHHGNTVTDYMAQERERDTPGHIDFTMEVEQTLDILDGAIIALDATAGVEAQTLTVWQQATNVPKIIFVNKMDRPDADLTSSCKSIQQKFNKPTVTVHMPIIENDEFIGVVDIITLEKMTWNRKDKDRHMSKIQLSEINDSELWKLANSRRMKLIDDLSNYDDYLANNIIESGSFTDIPLSTIIGALRRITIQQKAVPIFCGSAYKNIGIEPLMDAVTLYLPSPLERNLFKRFFEDNLCARAFKIIHDKQRGAMTFFRIYSGRFIKGQKIYNIQQNVTEQTGKLLAAFADEFEEVDELVNGNIAVVTGLKQTVSGDLITSTANVAHLTKKKLVMENAENILNTKRKIPEPVFLCSIEPPSLASQAGLEQALAELQREDPSFKVIHDQETGQVVLGGMGELHLEIIKDRILKEYKIQAELGPLRISYREAPIERMSCDLSTEMKIGNTKHSVSISLSLILVGDKDYDQTGILILDKTRESASNIANIFHKHLAAVRQGVQVSFLHGPKIGCQIINANVMLHMLEVARGTTDSVIVATTSQCVQKVLKKTGTYILEPIMWLDINCREECLSTILADLSRRRSAIRDINMRGTNKVILAEVPLSELLGYSTLLRTISSGTATFTMEFLEYRKMSPIEELKAIETNRGF